MKKLLVILMLFFLSGCASITYRPYQDYKSLDSGIYQAVRADFGWLDKKNHPDPELAGAEPLIYILAIGDIPFAFVEDTILMPFDIFGDISNMNKAKKLIDKYLPDYAIERNEKGSEKNGNYFYLVSPKGEKINVSFEIGYSEGEKYAFDTKFNSLLKEKNIKILTDEEAINIAELTDIIHYGRIVTDRWEYKVGREDSEKCLLWTVTVVGSNHRGGGLGVSYGLVLDHNNILQEVRRVKLY